MKVRATVPLHGFEISGEVENLGAVRWPGLRLASPFGQADPFAGQPPNRTAST